MRIQTDHIRQIGTQLCGVRVVVFTKPFADREINQLCFIGLAVDIDPGETVIEAPAGDALQPPHTDHVVEQIGDDHQKLIGTQTRNQVRQRDLILRHIVKLDLIVDPQLHALQEQIAGPVAHNLILTGQKQFVIRQRISKIRTESGFTDRSVF